MIIRKGYIVVWLWAIVVGGLNAYRSVETNEKNGYIFSSELLFKRYVSTIAIYFIIATVVVFLYYFVKDKVEKKGY